MSRSAKERADEHPDPSIRITQEMLGDFFFAGGQRSQRLGMMVSLWIHAVWKQSPSFLGVLSEPPLLNEAIDYGFVHVGSDGIPRLTGPEKNKRWLLDGDRRHCISTRRRSIQTYAVQLLGDNFVKIGRSDNVQDRVAALQTSSPRKVVLLGHVQGDHEKKLHRLLAKYRVSGEWFSFHDDVRAALTEIGILA